MVSTVLPFILGIVLLTFVWLALVGIAAYLVHFPKPEAPAAGAKTKRAVNVACVAGFVGPCMFLVSLVAAFFALGALDERGEEGEQLDTRPAKLVLAATVVALLINLTAGAMAAFLSHVSGALARGKRRGSVREIHCSASV